MSLMKVLKKKSIFKTEEILMGNHQLKTFTEMETLLMSIIERFVTLSIKKYKQQDKINKQTIQINELTSNLQLTRRQFRQAEH